MRACSSSSSLLLTRKTGWPSGSLFLFLLLAAATVPSVQSALGAGKGKKTGAMADNQPAMVGGWQSLDPEQAELQELLPRVMAKVNEQSNDLYHVMPIKILKASSQVVAGIKYHLEIQVARSECKKSGSNDNVDLKTCKRLEGHPDQIYEVEVWEKPWEQFLEVKVLKTKTMT